MKSVAVTAGERERVPFGERRGRVRGMLSQDKAEEPDMFQFAVEVDVGRGEVDVERKGRPCVSPAVLKQILVYSMLSVALSIQHSIR